MPQELAPVSDAVSLMAVISRAATDPAVDVVKMAALLEMHKAIKADAATPLGAEGFRALRAATTKPVVAIGGLKADNSAPVLAAGANGLAVVSGIVSAQDVKAAAEAFTRLFQGSGDVFSPRTP